MGRLSETMDSASQTASVKPEIKPETPQGQRPRLVNLYRNRTHRRIDQ
jgi:hypothetical protein